MITSVFIVALCSVISWGQVPVVHASSPEETALQFINEYVNLCEKEKSDSEVSHWLSKNDMITVGFLNAYRDLNEEARKLDPEAGLGFDPILNAQDYPDDGFELAEMSDGEYIIAKGVGWPEFRVVIRIKRTQQKWMVDGAGIVNIPGDRQRK